MGQTEIITFIILVSIVMLALICGIVIFVFQYYRKKVLYDNEKAHMVALHKAELLNAQLEIKQQTMQDIGREIHDNVGQRLTLASLYTQQLGYENRFPEINQQLFSIGNIINESLSELRTLSKSLTQPETYEADLAELVKKESDKINALGICSVKLSCNPPVCSLPSGICNFLLRVIQEFIQNSLKHAACRSIVLSIEMKDKDLTVYAQDDGRGFDISLYEQAEHNNGIGLGNIKKRAELLGAAIRFKSLPGIGTAMHIVVTDEIIKNYSV